MTDAAAAMNGRRLGWRELTANGPHAQKGLHSHAPALH